MFTYCCNLQENPNVRLVFRPASSSRNRPGSSYNSRKRGRPRKAYGAQQDFSGAKALDDSPPAKTRYICNCTHNMQEVYHAVCGVAIFSILLTL